MRLFLAVDLDAAARHAAAAWARDVSARLGASASREIKWVEAANLHLTLHFFGELDDARHEAMRAALSTPPFSTPAFDVSLSGAGVFPPSGPTRVIWLGVRDTDSDTDSGGVSNSAQMQTIYADVQSRLEPLGLQERATRGFTPHLTLGRVRTPNATLGRAIRDTLQGAPAPSTTFRVPHITLYQSRLSPKGPSYHVIAQFPLVAPQA
jgi:2'-5' RNA ligase